MLAGEENDVNNICARYLIGIDYGMKKRLFITAITKRYIRIFFYSLERPFL